VRKCVLVLVTDEDAVVPEIDDSLTSVTWTEEYMEGFDTSSGAYNGNDGNVDEAILAEDLSSNHGQPQVNIGHIKLLFNQRQTVHICWLFYCCCLDTISLIYDLILNFWKMYLRAKCRILKFIVSVAYMYASGIPMAPATLLASSGS